MNKEKNAWVAKLRKQVRRRNLHVEEAEAAGQMAAKKGRHGFMEDRQQKKSAEISFVTKKTTGHVATSMRGKG
eukprot:754200-Hanusia_phi.AAC.6